MNTLAIVSLVAAFIIPLVGIICGHISLGQIGRTGERGRGLAKAGLILGYIFLVLGMVAAVMIFVLAGLAASSRSTGLSGY